MLSQQLQHYIVFRRIFEKGDILLLFYKVSNYLLSLIAVCGAINERENYKIHIKDKTINLLNNPF